MGLPDTPVKLGALPSVEGNAGKFAGAAIMRTVPYTVRASLDDAVAPTTPVIWLVPKPFACTSPMDTVCTGSVDFAPNTTNGEPGTFDWINTAVGSLGSI